MEQADGAADGAEADQHLRLPRAQAACGPSSALGEGLVGQCAFEKDRILLTDVPTTTSRSAPGSGEAPPLNIVVLPVLFEGQVKAVIELASFHRFTDIHLTFLDQLTETIGIVLNTIAANMRTEDLLKQSQSLAEELQEPAGGAARDQHPAGEAGASLQESEELLRQQQDELQGANEELENKARQLSMQKTQVEGKNREIELAKQELEEKAEQLALTSKYKSEFLANMSHELRTPLNSLLILSELLADNPEGNLTAKQVEFARTIHDSGTDLLALINDILDMAKIESGTMAIEVGEVPFADLRDYVERTFRPVAETKGLVLHVDARRPSCRGPISTDAKRLQQVLQEPPVERLQVHRERPGRPAHRARPRAAGAPTTRSSTGPDASWRSRSATPASASRRTSSGSSSSRSSRPTGDRPQVRRHGPGPVDQPGDRPPARRRDPGPERGGQGQHVHLLSPARLRAGREPSPAGPRGGRAERPPGPGREGAGGPRARRGVCPAGRGRRRSSRRDRSR